MPNELETMVAAWQGAWFTKDVATIARLTADDYVYVAPNGAILDRATILAIAGDPTYGIKEGKNTENLLVKLGEDAALVRHRWQGTVTFRGQTFVEDHRCVTVCDRANGGWRIRYEHCSAVSP